MLEFFDTSVMGLVTRVPRADGDETDYLAEHHIPEVVRFDRGRLVDIRLDLSTLRFDPVHFMEYIVAGKWVGPPHALTPCIDRAAETMRRVLRFSRFCHGQMICARLMDAAAVKRATPLIPPCLD